jgi:hypothetical protein
MARQFHTVIIASVGKTGSNIIYVTPLHMLLFVFLTPAAWPSSCFHLSFISWDCLFVCLFVFHRHNGSDRRYCLHCTVNLYKFEFNSRLFVWCTDEVDYVCISFAELV